MQNLDAKPDGEASAARSRGRPRAFDRKEALERATRLFWTKGFEATSIADLTQAMGIGAPSLYAAFGSKEALFTEALGHYVETNEGFVWAKFREATTAREAVRSLLSDSAAALTGCVADLPRGCMVTLAAVDRERHEGLAECLRTARAGTLQRLTERFSRAEAEGELPASTDLHGLARYVQTLQAGMSILARDGADRAELEAVTDVAMAGWDARTRGD